MIIWALFFGLFLSIANKGELGAVFVVSSILVGVILMPTFYLVWFLARLAIVKTIAAQTIVAVSVAALSAIILGVVGLEGNQVATGAGASVVFSLFATVKGGATS
jgi:hypothetical protein